jgi:hypothetical protein
VYQVTQNDLCEYEENDKNRGMANTKLPPQRSKMKRIDGFGENVSQLPLCVNELHLYISLLNMVSQKVVSHFNVFGSPVEN